MIRPPLKANKNFLVDFNKQRKTNTAEIAAARTEDNFAIKRVLPSNKNLLKTKV